MSRHTLEIICAILLFMTLGLLPSLLIARELGVVVLQREVPAQTAYRVSGEGRTTSIDVSPDDKINQQFNGQHAITTNDAANGELVDSDIAGVSSGTPQAFNPMESINSTTVSEVRMGSSMGNPGGTASAQTVVPVMTGFVGPAVNSAGNNVRDALVGSGGMLNGLTGNISRTFGQ